MEEKKGRVKTIETLKEVSRFRNKWYADAHAAKERGGEIAWNMINFGFGNPILAAFDITSVWPEHFGAICTFTGDHKTFLPVAESEGFHIETCGYARIAYAFSQLYQKQGAPPKAPQGGMPKPDLLVGHTCCCDTRTKIYEAMKRYWDIPAFCLEHIFPPPGADFDYIKGYYVKFLVEELKRFIAWLEEHTGKKLDNDRLKSCVQLNSKIMDLYIQIFQLRQAKPCPMSILDGFTVDPFALFFDTDEATLDFFTKLRDELKYRVENKIGALPEEKYRLLWAVPPPPWYALPLLGYMESLGVVFPKELVYYFAPPAGIEVDDPLEALALRQWERYLSGSWICASTKPDLFANAIRDGEMDGLVIAMTTSCRIVVGQIYFRDEAERILGRKIPTLLLEADMVDNSGYSETIAKKKIDDFLETLESQKRGN